jgi:hypothetical protein
MASAKYRIWKFMKWIIVKPKTSKPNQLDCVHFARVHVCSWGGGGERENVAVKDLVKNPKAKRLNVCKSVKESRQVIGDSKQEAD